jgi:2-polyprenyl-3-methyl-5-hydroxy-6-metoxy-1,4-benzoquinol methylase
MPRSAAALTRTHCVLCRGPGDLLYGQQADRVCGTPGEYTLRECGACGVAWLDGEPDAEPHGVGYYTRSTDAARLRRETGIAPAERLVLAARLGYPQDAPATWTARLLAFAPPWRERCESIPLYLRAAPGARLLDVGCGNGIFAARMRDLGWTVSGVEPDADAAALARDAFGLDVHTGTLEDARLPAAGYDAVTLNHVIEHVPDPQATLLECRRVLRPGGRLVIITPNIASLGRRLFSEDWMHWDVPRHRFLFSCASLDALVRGAGLTTLSLRTTARSARWTLRRSRELAHQRRRGGALPATTVRGGGRAVAGIAFELAESMACSVSNAGEECVLIATVKT